MSGDTGAESERMERLRQACRQAGCRMTHQRLLVFNTVAGTNEHPDVETVYKKVRKRIPTISLDTVYRTLWMLRDVGVIATVGPPRERVHFDGNTQKHHHFVCSVCGRIYDYDNPHLDQLPVPERIESIGEVEMAHVELRGRCVKCLNGSDSRRTGNRRQTGR